MSGSPAGSANGQARHRKDLRPLRRYVAKRLLQLVPVLVGVSFLTFLVLSVLPGDPAVAILGQDADPDALNALREELDLDRPLLVRYGEWALNAMIGDLGTSLRTGIPVTELILRRAPVSLELMLLAILIALVAAVPMALVAAIRQRSVWDRAAGMSAFASLSLPNFVLALLLIQIFAIGLGWFPATGWAWPSDGIAVNLQAALLPALTLAASEYAVFMRLLRSDLIETLKEEYVLTAVAKGIPRWQVLCRHVLRNSLVSLVTVIGLTAGTLVGGAVITETIFAVPGIGQLLVDSIYSRDIPVVQGIVLLVGVAYVLINIAVDLCYTLLDPRVRHGRVDG